MCFIIRGFSIFLFFLTPICISFAGREELLRVKTEIQALALIEDRNSISYFDICDKIFHQRYGELHRLVWKAFKQENTRLRFYTREGTIVWQQILRYTLAIGCCHMWFLTGEQSHYIKQQYDVTIANEIAAMYKIACEAFEFRPLCAQELSFSVIAKHLIYKAAVESTTEEEFRSKLVTMVTDYHTKINQRYTEGGLFIGGLSAKIISKLSSFVAHEDPFISSIIPNLRLPKIVPNILAVIQESNNPFDFFVFSRLLRFNLSTFSEISDLCFRHTDFLRHKQEDFCRMCVREKKPLLEIESMLSRKDYHEVCKESKEFEKLGQELATRGRILENDVACNQAYERFLDAQLKETPDNAYRKGTCDALVKLLNILGSSSDLHDTLLNVTYNWIKSETRGGLDCWIRLACESLHLKLKRHSLCACLQAFSSSNGDDKALEFLSGNIIFLIRLACDNSTEPEMIQKLVRFARGNTNFSIAQKESEKQTVFSFTKEWLRQSLVQFFIWIGREDLALQLQTQFNPTHTTTTTTTTTTTISMPQPSELEQEREQQVEQQYPEQLESLTAPEWLSSAMSQRLTRLDCQQMAEDRERKAKLKAQRRGDRAPEEENELPSLEPKEEEVAETEAKVCFSLSKKNFETFAALMEFSGKPVTTRQIKKLIVALGGSYSPGGRGSHVTAHIPSFATDCDHIQLNGAAHYMAQLPAWIAGSGNTCLAEFSDSSEEETDSSEEGSRLVVLTKSKTLKPYQILQLRKILSEAGYSLETIKETEE